MVSDGLIITQQHLYQALEEKCLIMVDFGES
jgi:hypothetical protein